MLQRVLVIFGTCLGFSNGLGAHIILFKIMDYSFLLSKTHFEEQLRLVFHSAIKHMEF